MSRLDNFLNSQIEGDLLEVGLEFTVEPELARTKLAPFTEAVPVYGLLRYIQGLHQSGAVFVDIVFEPRSFRIVARFGESPPALSDIKRSFSTCELFDGSAMASLASGLVALTLLPPTGFTLSQGDKQWDLLSNGLDTQTEDGPQLTLELETERGSGYDRFDYMLEVQKRCRFAPCPISVDGQSLRPTITPTKVSAKEKNTAEYHTEWLEAGEGFRYDLVDFKNYELKDELLVAARLPFEIDRQESDDLEQGPVIYGGVRKHSYQEGAKWVECSRVIALATGYKTRMVGTGSRRKEVVVAPDPGQLIVIRHGVVCESMVRPDFVDECLVMLDCSSLKSDLSGLRTVQDESFESKITQTRQQMKLVTARTIEAYKPALQGIAEEEVEVYRKSHEEGPALGCFGSAIIYLLSGGGFDVMVKRVRDKAVESADRETKRLKDWVEKQSDG